MRLPRGVRSEEVGVIVDLRSSGDAVQWGTYWDGQWHVCQRTGVVNPTAKDGIAWRPWTQLFTCDVTSRGVAGQMVRSWIYARADAWVTINKTEKWRWEVGDSPKSRAFKRDAYQREGGDEGGRVFGGLPLPPHSPQSRDAWGDVMAGMDSGFIE